VYPPFSADKKPENNGTADGRRYTPIKAEKNKDKVFGYPMTASF